MGQRLQFSNMNSGPPESISKYKTLSEQKSIQIKQNDEPSLRRALFQKGLLGPSQFAECCASLELWLLRCFRKSNQNLAIQLALATCCDHCLNSKKQITRQTISA